MKKLKQILREWIKREKKIQKYAALEQKGVSIIRESVYAEIIERIE